MDTAGAEQLHSCAIAKKESAMEQKLSIEQLMKLRNWTPQPDGAFKAINAPGMSRKVVILAALDAYLKLFAVR